MNYDYSTMNLIRRASAHLDLIMRDLVQPLGITELQAWCLIHIDSRKRTTSSNLVNILHSDAGTMSLCLKRLEAKGLVIRNRSTDDTRMFLLSLSEDGLLMKQSVESTFNFFGDLARTALTTEDQSSVERWLSRILELGQPGRDFSNTIESSAG